jgi:hypothetical protein
MDVHPQNLIGFDRSPVGLGQLGMTLVDYLLMILVET